MLDFVTIGGATRDIFFKVEGTQKKKARHALEGAYLMLPYGEKMVSEETYYTYGGGAINAAVCLRRLGLRVAPRCNIGQEGTGSLLLRTLQEERINTSLVRRDTKHHTGLSVFIIGADNEHTGFLERGANSYLTLGRLRPAKWFYISSLTGESAKLLPQIFEYAQKHRIKVAFNPGSQQLAEGDGKLHRFIEQSEIVILNLDEAERLLATQKKRLKNKRNLLAAVGRLGARITVVTEADDGSHAWSDGKVYSQEALSTKVIDTTGAGDAFGATFAFGISQGFDIQTSLKYAAKNSASVVGSMGAQDGLMSYNEVKRSQWQ